MRILAHTSLHFHIILYTYFESMFLAPLSGRSYCVDIDNNALDITLDQLFFIYLFYYTHLTIVLGTWSLLLFVYGSRKVNLLACEDKVKVNYFLLILM